MSDLRDQLQKIKSASMHLATMSDEQRQHVLVLFADKLRQSVQQICQENAKDLALMDPRDPKYDRLLLTEARIQAMADDVNLVANSASPLNSLLEEKTLPNGLLLQKLSVPLGVVAVIYESRPNVTVDVFSLCFKAGNACVLKGGKEAHYTNQYFSALIQQILHDEAIDSHVCYVMPSNREATLELLSAIGLIDVCIPRGSDALIRFVREHARIPVIETGAGIVHTYVDQSADLQKSCRIIENAKTRRVSVCNALDSLIIHKHMLPKLGELIAPLAVKNVEIYADKLAYQALEGHYPAPLLKLATIKDFGHEFLAYKMSIKTVTSVEEAVAHIAVYSSGHSEAIITEDKACASYFLTHVDAAAVYVNASTAFTDGGQFGFGAEIGISTQKLHARGPMGLAALTSYKWVIWGDGQIRE